MKIAALICGLLASAFAWGAGYFLADLSGPFLSLWPQSNSQQFLGLLAWHGMIATALLGGLITVFAPLLGALLLVGAAGAWVWVGLTLPAGFAPQIVVPLAFAAVGAVAAIGAMVRGRVRRSNGRGPSAEDMEREEALRLEPDDELVRAIDVRQATRNEPPVAAPARDDDEAIRVAVPRRAPAAPPGVSMLYVLNFALLLLLTAAVAFLLYANLRSGELLAALGGPPVVASASATPADVTPPEAPAPDVAAIEAATPAAQTGGDAGVATAEVRVSSAPLDLTKLPPQAWTDPFAYCAAMGNMDYPDHRYSGARLPEDIAAALRVPASSPPERARWRCADGQVLVCRSFRGIGCALTPTITEMRSYCEQNPNATDLWAPNGTWSCNDTIPELPPGASWPVDGRGFLPGAWVTVAKKVDAAPSP